MRLTQRLQDERGFTIVELLVAMVLTAIVMTVVSTGVITAMRVQRRQVDQVDAVARARVALERMTREVRATNPLIAASPDGTSISVQVTRPVAGWNRKITTYSLVGDEVQVSGTLIDTTTDASQPIPPKTLLKGIALNPGEKLFTYRLADGTAATATSDLRLYASVTITLRVPMRESNTTVRVADTVNFRNAGA